jgi:hypothetical protein
MSIDRYISIHSGDISKNTSNKKVLNYASLDKIRKSEIVEVFYLFL